MDRDGDGGKGRVVQSTADALAGGLRDRGLRVGRSVTITSDNVDRMLERIDRLNDPDAPQGGGGEGVIDAVAWLRDETAGEPTPGAGAGGATEGRRRAVDPETGEVRRERRRPPDPETREARWEGYIGPGDPDDLWPSLTFYGGINLGKRTVSMPFGESRDLAELGAALIERDGMLRPLATWELRIAYLWGEDLGKVGGEPRLWRLKKADPLSVTLLGMCQPPRVVDLFLFANARVVSFGEMTRWQMQATLHEALGCAKVRDGRVTVEALSAFWQAHIMRRYGPTWRPDLAQLAEVMRLAEREQLPLWPDDEEDE